MCYNRIRVISSAHYKQLPIIISNYLLYKGTTIYMAITLPYSYGHNYNCMVRPTSKELYMAVPYNTVQYGYGRIVTGYGQSIHMSCCHTLICHTVMLSYVKYLMLILGK